MRKYLRKLREQSGLTQAETAKKLDISESYYSLIENGERQRRLNISLVTKISRIFKVSVEDIAAEEEKI